jgi:hypothetical protein
MVVVCRREVLIAAPGTHNLAGALRIHSLDVGLRMSRTPAVEMASAVKA